MSLLYCLGKEKKKNTMKQQTIDNSKERKPKTEEHSMLPQYIRIAVDIASRIVKEKYPERLRLPGESVLSSEYSVSQETVRKAARLLSNKGIVEVRERCGVVVLSKAAAGEYLETINLRESQSDLRNQLQTLFSDYNVLGQKILEICDNMIAASSTPLPANQALPYYEVTVPEISDKVNMTIGDLRFWQRTGATIVVIKRGQNTQISPGPYATLRAGDVLVYVGTPDSQRKVQQFFITGKTESTIYHVQQQINTAVHMKEIALVAESLGARLGDITDFIAMEKGMTNHSYLFTCRGLRYILRIPGEGTVNLIDRGQEADVYRAIAGTGLCDDVVYLNPQNGLKVTRFLDGVSTCDPYNEDNVKKCMAMLRRFHSIKLQVGHSFDIFGNIERYESLWDGTPASREDYEETKANVLSLRPFVEAHQSAFCLTHIDAVPDNFLFYPREGEERLQLTDWEYSGMQDPHVDIAMFCIYSLYDRAQVDRLIDIYFDAACDRAVRVKIYCYIAACGLLWSNWAEYKRKLGVEFGDYAQHQYHYAQEYYKISKKEMEKI